MSELFWKSYGDSGRTAIGDHGRWRIVTDGKWWHLTVQPAPLEPRENRGKFVERDRAMEFAQEREDGVVIQALGVSGSGQSGDTQ